MNKAVKKLLLPAYYTVLRAGRNSDLLRNIQIKICISSTKKYAGQTVPLVTNSLLGVGIAANDIYVFEGGHTSRQYAFGSFHHYKVDHNSFDMTALIEIVSSDVKSDYWFLLHDTCLVDERFRTRIHNIPHFLPETLPVKNYPSMNMGAYRHDYLLRKAGVLMDYKNDSLDHAAAIRFKEKCVRDEDILFRQSKRPVAYNGWLLHDDDNYKRTDVTAPAAYTNRICEYYPQVGVYKFKANFRLEQAAIIEL